MFYVYCLYRPWDMTPCYVGKGKGNRVHDHAKRGSAHHNKHLANIIGKAGGEVPFAILLETDDEALAFAEESRLITEIGRADLKLGPLCNLTDGGEGASGRIQGDAERAARSEFHKDMWANLNIDERRERVKALNEGARGYWRSLSAEERRDRLRSAHVNSSAALQARHAQMTGAERTQSTIAPTEAARLKWRGMNDAERAEIRARKSSGMKRYLATLSDDQKKNRTAAAVARRIAQRAECGKSKVGGS